ncbi:MAG: tetratricopeptide repeat protein [Candidatus Heimdallarchaeota archaeon]|nr:tetratricopeptide repeat protein [Candidatus Heimdallarchaeota archaeon]
MKDLIKRAQKYPSIPQKILNTIGIIKITQNRERLIPNIRQLVDYLILNGDYEAALKQLEVLKKMIEDHHSLEAYYHKNRGIIFRKQGLFEKSLKEFETALSLYQELKDKSGKADIIGEMGLIHIIKGEYIRALELVEKSRDLYKKKKEKVGMGIASANMALIYELQGEISKALNYYFDALKLLEKEGHPVISGKVLSNLSAIYFEKGDIFKALSYLDEAVKIHELLDDDLGKKLAAIRVSSHQKMNNLIV